MRRSGPAACVGLVLAVAAAACGPDEVTLPTPPKQAETAALVALYDMPTAILDEANIDQTLSDARARLDELDLQWLPDVVTDTLVRLRDRLDAGGLPDDPADPANRMAAQITAVANVHRICTGWDSPAAAPDEATNGSIDVTAIVDTGVINPEIWGTANTCRTRFPPAETAATNVPIVSTVVKATLDATLIIYILGPLPRSGAEAQFLLSFDGSIAINDQTRSASFDFEIVNRSVRFRIPAGGGDAIVSVGATLGIQGANAGFSCDLGTLTCTRS